MSVTEASLKHASLGERLVMAARMMTAEHLRQEADDAGIDVERLQHQVSGVRLSDIAAAVATVAQRPIRQDLFRQPAFDGDGREAA